MNRFLVIPMLALWLSVACDSDSGSMEPLKQVIFDPESYSGDTATFTNSSITLLYPSDWVADYGWRDYSVILSGEMLDPVFGALDSQEQCSLRSEYHSGKTLEEVTSIYASGNNNEPTVEFLNVNTHNTSRIWTRAISDSEYILKYQIVQGHDDYYHAVRCSGVSETEKSLILNSLKLSN